jgi:inorganic phosphate transporter, PiT family
MEQILIILALVFAFINGFHDSANSIATIVFTRVLSPGKAVLWASLFNFIAFILFGLYVAETIGRGIIDISIFDNNIILAALASAIIWDIFTWYFALPTSSSHALIGGLIGSAIIKAGSASLLADGIVKTAIFIFVSPLIGLLLGLTIGAIIFKIFKNTDVLKADNFFNKGQIISSALYSLGHGGNDAQKTIGVIALILFSNGMRGAGLPIPYWVIISSYAAIAIGTLCGGWRIVKTMGERLTKLHPVDGFCIEIGAAITLYITSFLGVPVSTTQTITGSIVGVGMLRRLSAIHWGITGRVVWTWIFTIPCTAAISALVYIIKTNLAH